MSRLLDRSFVYRNSASTNVADTWRRFGYRPTTQAEREARQRGIRLIQLRVHRATLVQGDPQT